MKCSKDVIKKCRKENKKKERKIQCQLYKMFYQNICILGCKNVIQGVELSEKENRVYITNKKDSASHSISLNVELDSFKMYVFSFETSNHDIKYHFFSDSEVGNNKKYSIEEIYKVNKNKKRTLIKYYANYRDLIVLLDFSCLGLCTT